MFPLMGRDAMLRCMKMFVVALERRFHGSPCGSTEDVIEAKSEAEAVEFAARAWKRIAPGFTFAPLFSGPAR
jgi:hypothetical protein